MVVSQECGHHTTHVPTHLQKASDARTLPRVHACSSCGGKKDYSGTR